MIIKEFGTLGLADHDPSLISQALQIAGFEKDIDAYDDDDKQSPSSVATTENPVTEGSCNVERRPS